MITNQNYWDSAQPLQTKNYRCGYPTCGKEVGADKEWTHKHANNPGHVDGLIYLCPLCKNPTFFDVQGQTQFPGVSLGSDIQHLPPEVEPIWTEIRACTSHSAFTSAVLSGRKLLMHIAVAQGADPELSFVKYVDYLVNNHYAPPNSKSCIDKIRTHGNESAHEIVLKTKDDLKKYLRYWRCS